MKRRKQLILLTLIAMNLVEQPAPEVTIEQGVLQGKISEDGSFYEYLGIPYATTNTTARFQAPLPPPSWTGVYKAVEEKDVCPQKSLMGVSGAEDCLKMNVYVPVAGARPLPVMVYIHGGAFVLGSGGKFLYAPEYLVKHNVVLVTFNYRLGALGFLCLGIKEAPGNAGLKDQVAALRWVKANIGAFGGDPDNITIFGESAGGTSTSLMIATNTTNGLFNKAIVQSGSSISNWAVNRNPVWTASLLAKAMGYQDTKDPYELYEIFAKVPFVNLVKAKTTKPWEEFFETQLIHLPCVEKSFPGIEPVITDIPYNLLTAADRKNISVIYGYNNKEGLFLIGEETNDTLSSRNDGYMFASDLEFASKNEALTTSKLVNKFYFGDDRITINKIMNISDIYSHLYFEVPALLESEIFLENPHLHVYNYYFKYSGGRNLVKYMSGHSGESGACHGDDILYLFKGRLWPFWVTSSDKVIIDWMSTMWTNFAKYGEPTPTFAPELPLRWLPSTKGNINVLYIDKELTMGPIPNRRAYHLWKEIYSKYRKRTPG